MEERPVAVSFEMKRLCVQQHLQEELRQIVCERVVKDYAIDPTGQSENVQVFKVSAALLEVPPRA